jgi:branched-chain amino acid transport system ATP-binding protein
MTLLVANALRKYFGGVEAVVDVGFAVAPSEVVALIGPNGAGKSTCFNMLNGQLAPDRGTIQLDGKNIAGLPPRAVAHLGVGRTFQITATFASMRVRENVQVALQAFARKSFGLWRSADALCRDEALALLARVGMADQAERPCGTLAYGDLKRVELAVALAGKPQLLLMDEPTAGMAPAERIALMALTASLARRDKIGVLFTEHDMDTVFAHADRILVLDRGRLIAEGSPETVRNDPTVRRVYLGAGSMYGEQS